MKTSNAFPRTQQLIDNLPKIEKADSLRRSLNNILIPLGGPEFFHETALFDVMFSTEKFLMDHNLPADF